MERLHSQTLLNGFLRVVESVGLVDSDPYRIIDRAHFLNQYQGHDEKKIPSERLKDTILFFGRGNYDGLKTGVSEQLSAYEMLSKNVENTISLVEKAYRGRFRRTGEPEFAHILRIMGYTAEFIHTFHLWDPQREVRHKLQDKYFDPDMMFNKHLVDMILIGVLLHDFVEPEIKKDKKTHVMGNVTFISSINSRDLLKNMEVSFPDRDPGIWIDLYEEQKDVKPSLTDRVHITDIPEAYYAHFAQGLNSLDSFGIEDVDKVTSKLGESMRNLMRDLPSFFLTPYYFPVLIKLFDRLDNVATYTFRQDEESGELTTYPDDKIYDKAKETLRFARFEDALGRIISNIPLYVLTQALTLGNINSGKYNPIYVGMMPSIWAKKTLIGEGIGEIWTMRKAESASLTFPRLI